MAKAVPRLRFRIENAQDPEGSAVVSLKTMQKTSGWGECHVQCRHAALIANEYPL